MTYGLPTILEVNGREYPIETDFRAVLDVFELINDPELTNQDKAIGTLYIMYPDFDPEGESPMPADDYGEALKKAYWFINGGAEEVEKKAPKLIDWEQDYSYIVAPINRVLGAEVRALEYLHWWTFLAAYYEIGDCLLSQIVRIRKLKAQGRLKDKADREWYRENRELVDFKVVYTDAEKDILAEWGLK